MFTVAPVPGLGVLEQSAVSEPHSAVVAFVLGQHLREHDQVVAAEEASHHLSGAQQLLH
ncbi:hypothetical protein [Nocardia asiatica]|uniref:hypothetical protein n=1 Tax=Nocardia asiatica TaxID=209252 RepID=UPI002456B915|nr:hypothetical protein [Nocardia asiatica]